MSFETDYNILLQIATAEIRNKKLINADPSDFVSECYLVLIENKTSYSLDASKKIINRLCYKQLDTPIHSQLSDINKPKYFYTENSRPCKFCGEEMPINCFRIRSNSTGRRDTMCDSCRNKEARDYFKKNRDRCIKRSTDYWKENKDKLNAYKRSRYVSKRKTPKKEKVIKDLKIKAIKIPKKPNKRSLFYWI